MTLLTRFKEWLLPTPCSCAFCCYEPAPKYIRRREIGGKAQLLTPASSKDEAVCRAPEGHDYCVALERPCDYCGAAL